MTWIVTGGASGIGAQLAADLLAAGEQVTVWDRVAPQNPALAHEVVDLLVEDDIKAAAGRAAGPLRGFVHCAGIPLLTDSTDPDIATALRRSFDLHVVAFAVAVRSLLPVLSQGSSIVAITSSAQRLAFPGTLAYGATKAALGRVVEQMAVELAPRGIRVNAVSPGAVASPMTADAWADPEQADARRAFIPLGRQATAAEVSAAVRFLTSEGAAFITGETIWVDGGTRHGMYNRAIQGQMAAAAGGGAR